MNTVKVDFSEKTGKIKPLHGVCCAPYSNNLGSEQRVIDTMFKEAHIPYCRLHDCCYPYGVGKYVDVPNIFPDFDADENDPANYNFYFTDEYIGAIQAAGTESYYRLGTSIDWASKKTFSVPPKDFAKWARICEHIIMHYNEGWADGFHYNLQYWEIWNEPENPPATYGKSQWTGTDEEFYAFYEVASKHLKNCFPHLKIGGYGGCGFYAITRENVHPTRHDFITFFINFLKMVKEKECPLDFYSWHIYSADEKELLTHAKYVRETLDAYGFKDTESHLNEWNIHAEGSGYLEKHTIEGASFNAAVLCMLQNEKYVDMAHYYAFSYESSYNGFFNRNDFSVDVPWYAFVAFGELYRLGDACKVKATGEGIYAAAAENGDEQCIMIANYKCDDDALPLVMKNAYPEKMADILYITERHRLEPVFGYVTAKENTLSLRLPRQSVVLIRIR